MSKRADPFAGFKLSDLSTPPSGPLDQQLFRPSPPRPAIPEAAPSPSENRIVPQAAHPPELDQPRAHDPDVEKPENQHAGNPENQETSKPVFQKTRKPENQKPGKSEGREVVGEGFDINLHPDHKDTFFMTDTEFYSLEELKLKLKRQLGVKVIKDDLARCAFNLLLEDSKENGEQRFIVRHLKNKKGK